MSRIQGRRLSLRYYYSAEIQRGLLLKTPFQVKMQGSETKADTGNFEIIKGTVYLKASASQILS